MLIFFFENKTIPFQIVTLEETHEKFKKQYIFQLSSLNPQERIDYCHLIEKLGTSVLFENVL
jgi:topoisomerase (DNA) II binding protein 1